MQIVQASKQGASIMIKAILVLAFLFSNFAFLGVERVEAASDELNFLPVNLYSLNGKPTSGYNSGPIIADINDDGNQDIITAHFDNDNISVMLGTGQGMFEAADYYSVGDGANMLIAQDLNNDGPMDVIVSNGFGNSISVLLGNSDGTLSAAVNYAAGTTTSYLTSGDFNGDGAPDIATTNSGSNNVSVFLGNGDGSMNSAVNYSALGLPTLIQSGFINSDSNLDLVVSTPVDGEIVVLLGVGDGTFAAGVSYAVGSNMMYQLILEDFNNDNNVDVAIGRHLGGDGEIDILLGIGDGSFSAMAPYNIGGIPSLSQTQVDINGDAYIDLIFSYRTENSIGTLLNNGDGTFGSLAKYSTGVPNFSEEEPLVVDLNNDGVLDIVQPSRFHDVVSLLLGNDDGTFDAATTVDVDEQPGFRAAADDLNNDGLIDLVVPHYGPNETIAVLINVSGYESVTYTSDDDFLYNSVVGPDMIPGTADDGDAGTAGDRSNVRVAVDSATLRGEPYVSAKAGDYYTTAGIKESGTLWVAGGSFNWMGDEVDQLCQDSAYQYLSKMTQVGTDSDWVYFNAGFDTLHMIKSDGTLWGCGEAGGGQLGVGSEDSKDVPTQIGTDNDWAAVWGADWHTIGQKTDGSLWAWGADWCGNLGQGTEDEQQNSPVKIGNDTDWVSVSAGDTHNLAIKADGSLWGWGCDYTPGELGMGDNPEYAVTVPTRIGTDNDWAFAAAGFLMSAAIKTDGSLWTFGEAYGLGVGDENPRNVPTRVGSDNDWESVSVGFFHMVGKKTDGSIWGWGENSAGELGQGSTSSQVLEPVRIGDRNDWDMISAGDSYTLALDNDGIIWTTGANYDGELAIGDHWEDRLYLTEVNSPPYYPAGQLSGLKVNAGEGNEGAWKNLFWSSFALPADTEIRFRVRTSNDDVTYSAWSSYFTQDVDDSVLGFADLSGVAPAQYLEMELSLTTADSLETPELLDFTINYNVQPAGTGGGGGTAPSVTSAAATAVTQTDATLNAEVTDIGSQAPTQRGFEFGYDNTYGDTMNVGAGGVGTFSIDVGNLTCNTTYHFRAFATSPDGTGYGSDQSFTTSACATPPPTGGNSSSGSTANPFEPIIAPILPIIPLPAPVPAEEPTNDTPPVFNCIAEPCDDSSDPAEEPTQEENPIITPTVEEPEDDEPFTPLNVIPIRGTNGTRIFDQVSGWFSSGVELVPLATLSSTGLVALAALLPLAVSASTLAVAASSIPLGLSGLQLIYSRYFQNLLSFLGLRKKRRVWGTVYDSQTKQPLDPAVVELIDSNTGEVVERAITDLAGRFGFLAREGTFLLRASKTHYAFPSKKETGSTDEIFDNLYHGEQITLSESTLVAPNIPMDPVGFDWNQEAKQKLLPSRLRLHYLVQVLFDTVFIFGFAFAIYNVANNPGTWNYVALGLYILVLLLRWLIKPKHLWGRLTKDHHPLADVKVELLHPKFNVVMGKALSTIDGKFFLKVPEPGEYNMRVSTRHGLLIEEAPVEVGKESVLNAQLNF